MTAAETWGKGHGVEIVPLDTYLRSPTSVPFYESRMGYARRAVIFRKEIETAPDSEGKRAELIEEYTERFANPYIAAERGYVDDVIDPRETRRVLIRSLAMLRTKREQLPQRKHGNVPL